MRTALVIVPVALLALVASIALADPPGWAPAHGYRDKHNDNDHDRDDKHGKHRGERESYYVGYSGIEYERDFDIPSGRCDREKVGAVLGGVAGGVVGNQIGNRDNRVFATILGATVGALIGAKIGRDMDDRDRGCVGHALELGTDGHGVRWTNRESGVRFVMIPLGAPRGGAQICRNFRLTSTRGSIVDTRDGRACQVRPGAWELGSR
jgi:surface antigen